MGKLPPKHAEYAGPGSLWADSAGQPAAEISERTTFNDRAILFDVSFDGQDGIRCVLACTGFCCAILRRCDSRCGLDASDVQHGCQFTCDLRCVLGRQWRQWWGNA